MEVQSGLKVCGGGWDGGLDGKYVVCKPTLLFIFRPSVELNNIQVSQLIIELTEVFL